MVLDLIIQEAEGMTDEALMEVVRFMRFMKIEATRKATETKQGKRKVRTGGIYHGQIRIADDFDAPLSTLEVVSTTGN